MYPNKKDPNKVGSFVPRTGFEPAHPFRLYHLKVACLPISPPGLFKDGKGRENNNI